MSSQSTEAGGVDTVRAEPLKIWSCINCRRRKVRCDRRHPCAPCSRNKTECVFPISGRIPRRDRNLNYPNPPAQRQADLLGRLRRLEAMVGDLGSQVEHAEVPVESSASTSSILSLETGLDHWTAHSQSARENHNNASDASQTSSSIAGDSSELPNISSEISDIVVDNEGDLIVGNRFWTVFCKEVFLVLYYSSYKSRLNRSSKSPTGIQFSALTEVTTQHQSLVIEATAIITFFLVGRLLEASERMFIPFLHKYHSSGRSTRIMSIHS
jgi:hypothetical protein